jgi:hypothetical protein
MRRAATIVLVLITYYWFYAHVYQRVLIGGQTLVIEDVTTRNILRIRKDFDRGDARKLRLYISGKLNGKAEIIRSSENMPPQSYSIGPGKVALSAESSWQDPSCTIEYTPDQVTKGSLSVRYSFSTDKKKKTAQT